MKFTPYTDEKVLGTPDFAFWCPGCKHAHALWVDPNRNDNQAKWSFNGDLERPTVSPSIKVTYPTPSGMRICHSFIRNGMIEFCDDSTHELAGKTVELPDFPID